jgi:surface polysaccharide O-acyltransferase-like enzyme
MEESLVLSDATATPAAVSLQRRYDVDWLRTLALGLLIGFHIVLSFQSWAASSGFPQNDELLDELAPFMSMLAIWRIPLLFLISGMGVRFAMERRDWKQLLKDRTIRIVVPFVFNVYVFGTILGMTMVRLGWDAEFSLSFGHLWFLANIFAYFLWLLSTMAYLKDHPNCWLLRFLSKIIRWRFGLFLFAVPLMVEAWLVNPEIFSIYVDTLHGWLIGLICFFWGFIFICTQEDFWPAVARTRWLALAFAVSGFLVRLLVFELQAEPNWLTAFESMSWMLAALGFGSLYLNKPSRGLGYFSRAVYPVYILHMPVQFTIAYFLLPLSASAYLKLALLLVGTFGICLLLYEYVLRRLRWIRPLFGMKLNQG